jgi:hypothetical protein
MNLIRSLPRRLQATTDGEGEHTSTGTRQRSSTSNGPFPGPIGQLKRYFNLNIHEVSIYLTGTVC